MTGFLDDPLLTPENLARARDIGLRSAHLPRSVSDEDRTWLREFLRQVDPDKLQLALNPDFVESYGQMQRSEGTLTSEPPDDKE